ncbi:MAG: hypothetical protein KME64_04050 [Scytonematopsis contorta HA4267-MV1]|jgi:hypothetical protein|nr:hypothetical protein [Scytonematopsis contorta HA4267-MV1]
MKPKYILGFGVLFITLLCSNFSVAKAQKRSSAELVKAIKNATGDFSQDILKQIRYYTAYVDLNNDKSQEVIVYSTGPHCGAWECPVYIFRKSGKTYRLIGKSGAASNGGQVAVLSSKSKGWLDIATLVYDSQQRKVNWKLHKYNGSTYQNTYNNLNSKPSRIILRPSGSGFTLAQITGR